MTTKTPAQITGLHIALDGACRLVTLPKQHALARLYELTASETVEAPPLDLGGTRCHLYIDEEGKYRQEANMVATMIWRQAYQTNDYIAGPALLVGPPDRHGYETSVPAKALRHLRECGLEISEDETK